MAVQHHVRNPIEWGWDRLKETGQAIGSAAGSMDGAWETRDMAPPVVRKIGLDDLRQALREGARDFGACRTDVVFLCMIYPIAGLIISRFAFDYGMLPLIFPLVSGFALIAPLFGVGLYEMSRRASSTSPGVGRRLRRRPLARDRLDHGAGPRADRPVRAVARRRLFHLHGDARSDQPVSALAFRARLGHHAAGLDDGDRGVGVGFLFALLVLAISVVSFPLLLDRNVGVRQAVATSFRAVRENPGPMAAWGLIIAAGLVIGAIPLLVGLAIILPILGHATWHLYRKVVAS